MNDQLHAGPMGEDEWKDQRIASLEAYIAQLKDELAGRPAQRGADNEIIQDAIDQLTKSWIVEEYFRDGFKADCQRLVNTVFDVLAERPAPSIPRATGSNAEGDWRIDFAWLENMRGEIEKATGYDLTIECLEEAVLRTEALCRSPAECEQEPIGYGYSAEIQSAPGDLLHVSRKKQALYDTPLYLAPIRSSQLASSPAGCADQSAIYQAVLKELETKHLMPTSVMLATRITNAIGALQSQPGSDDISDPSAHPTIPTNKVRQGFRFKKPPEEPRVYAGGSDGTFDEREPDDEFVLKAREAASKTEPRG